MADLSNLKLTSSLTRSDLKFKLRGAPCTVRVDGIDPAQFDAPENVESRRRCCEDARRMLDVEPAVIARPQDRLRLT